MNRTNKKQQNHAFFVLRLKTQKPSKINTLACFLLIYFDGIHFPIQNLLKILASKSSVEISPVIVPK
jgi:hypothetical protein